jgi:hypothetical protein
VKLAAFQATGTWPGQDKRKDTRKQQETKVGRTVRMWLAKSKTQIDTI